VTVSGEINGAKQVILKNCQSPGDIVMLTAAVRDLHRSHPRKFLIDVRTPTPELWMHNPFIVKLDEKAPHVRSIRMQYPMIHSSNRRPYHFIHGFVNFLETHLALHIPVTDFRGDIYLSDSEREPIHAFEEAIIEGRGYWIIVAGGKLDFTAKWWNPQAYQRVVDHFHGDIQFVQCGDAEDWHPPLSGVVNMVGKTTIREFIRLIYHTDGVVCPVTFAMHLAAAVEMPPGKPKHRPCVVLGGGREPPHWEAYPFHQYISTVGMLPCCDHGGCWRSRCQLVGDGDEKDSVNVCDRPVQVSPDLRIPQCMQMIRPEDVIRRIEMYLEWAKYDRQPAPLVA